MYHNLKYITVLELNKINLYCISIYVLLLKLRTGSIYLLYERDIGCLYPSDYCTISFCGSFGYAIDSNKKRVTYRVLGGRHFLVGLVVIYVRLL